MGKEVDEWFQHKRERSLKTQDNKFNMMVKAGKDLDKHTRAFTMPDELLDDNPGGVCAALDLCMAPGGFTQCILDNHGSSCRVDALSLPIRMGGYLCLMIPSPELRMTFADINVFVPGELGAEAMEELAETGAAEQRKVWPYEPHGEYGIAIVSDL